MNVITTEIKPVNELTVKEKESGDYLQLTSEQYTDVENMNRKDRRKWLKQNGYFKKKMRPIA